jgi:hypothetical protein
VVQLAQKNFELSSQPPSWKHLFSGTKLGYCWSSNSKRVQQPQKASTRLSWVKWRRKWSLNGGEAVTIVSFLQDNASSITDVITQRELADLHFEVLKHAANSPNLGTSNYCVFLNLKKN